MKAETEIKKQLIAQVMKWNEGLILTEDLDTEEGVSKQYEILDDQDYIQDARNDFRTSFSHRTEIKCEWSRHYESESVAVQLDNGKWVGWTHWHGGGKHGEPSAIDWMEDAYFLKATPKVVTTYDFEKEA